MVHSSDVTVSGVCSDKESLSKGRVKIKVCLPYDEKICVIKDKEKVKFLTLDLICEIIPIQPYDLIIGDPVLDQLSRLKDPKFKQLLAARPPKEQFGRSSRGQSSYESNTLRELYTPNSRIQTDLLT